MTEESKTAKPSARIVLGHESYITGAELSGYWITTASGGTERIRISDCTLTDCDLGQADWANFENCTIVGGKLPLYGYRDQAINCTVVEAAQDAAPVT